MWYFTKHGFYSVVCARKGGKKGAKIDPTRVTVRARRYEHLENLVAECPFLSDHKIVEAAGTDYPFRMVLPFMSWNQAAAHLTGGIDYDNFKDAVLGKDGRSEYEKALHAVWRVMCGIEEDRNDPEF